MKRTFVATIAVLVQNIAHVPLLVRDYDEAIAFYCGKLGFHLVEDTQRPDKRWVRIRPSSDQGSDILLSKAIGEKQLASVGNQTGGRVLCFVAASVFALYAPVEWAFVPPLAAGFLVGGYAGQRLARHLPVAVLRVVVALAGLALAVKLGITAYR